MLRLVNQSDLDNIRHWRNAPSVRKTMFTDHVISVEEHLSWWKSIRNDASRLCLLYVHDGVEAGVVNFFDINHELQTCHWGFYLSYDIEGAQFKLQAWQSLEEEAIDYAFNELKCQQLFCETFRFNQPVLEMHKRFGFVEVSIEKRQKGETEQDVVVTALTSDQTPAFTRFKSECLLMASSNLDFIKHSLNHCAERYSIEVKLTDIPYGQYQIAINDPDSSIYKNIQSEANRTLIFLERIEDLLLPNTILCCDILNELSIRWTEYLSFIRQSRLLINGSFIIANAASTSSWLMDADPESDDNKKITLTLTNMHKELEQLCNELPDVHILDLVELISNVGREAAHPEKYWYLSRAPFSTVFNERLSETILALMMSIEEKNARVIVSDLDNTLWSGIVGDEGIEGIVLDGDYPANVFQTIQSVLLSFKNRGILLALCSKNTEQTALDVFRKHSGMQLSLDDLTAWRINWQPKPDNLIELSNELGLPLSSFCVLDDNPAEREEIRSCLPEVFVPELPDEISEWPEIIKRLPELADMSTGDEDRNRALQYKIRADLNKQKLSDDSRSRFLTNLGMVLSLEPYNELNQQRVLQLINKTNQFNTTTQRYNRLEFEKYLQIGECFAIRLKDRLSHNEIIGVLMLTYDKTDDTFCKMTIDNFLLSCRVLGRDIEIGVMAWLSTYSKQQDVKMITGEIVPTNRNQPVQSLYSKLGFEQQSDTLFEIDLTRAEIHMPSWLTLLNKADK